MRTDSLRFLPFAILLVDGNRQSGEFLAIKLMNEGFRVRPVGSMADAVEEVRRDRYDAVLLEAGFACHDQQDMAKHLVELDPTLPIILFSNQTATGTSKRALDYGIFAYLTTSCNMTGLTVTLRRAVETKTLADKAQRAEAALRESEERFRSVVESAPDAIVLADHLGKIISWNKSAQRLFGYAEKDVLGKSLTILMPPRYRSAHERGLERVRCSGDTRVTGKTIELHGLRQDGTEFPLELSLAAWNTHKKMFYGGIIRDITERKRAEEALRESELRFRQVTENIQEVFWMTDLAKTQMLYVSPAYETIWGRSCESLYAVPRSWLDAIHPEDRERVALAALTKQANGQYSEEYRIVRLDGSIRWIWDRAFPIRNESGTVYRLTGIAEDITEYKQLRDQLIQTEKLASLGTLVSGMAHEVNNPVQGILGTAEIMLLEKNVDKMREYAKDIVDYSRHVAEIIRDFACYARTPAHNGKEDLDLRERLAEAVKMVRHTPQYGNVEVMTRFEAVPLFHARRTELDQVFVNLISNAVQAMNGTGRLTLTTMVQNETVTVSVADTGCGIPKELVGKIFDPFFTTKDPGKGTGLGLSIVHKIVTSYGGRISMETEEGKGTIFTVHLPKSNLTTKEG